MGRLIDADALLDRIPSLYERREVSRWVDEAPTVDAVLVAHGKWEKHKGIFICSRCLTGYKEQPTMMGEPLFEFCPVCGTKMDGKDGDHETD